MEKFTEFVHTIVGLTDTKIITELQNPLVVAKEEDPCLKFWQNNIIDKKLDLLKKIATEGSWLSNPNLADKSKVSTDI